MVSPPQAFSWQRDARLPLWPLYPLYCRPGGCSPVDDLHRQSLHLILAVGLQMLRRLQYRWRSWELQPGHWEGAHGRHTLFPGLPRRRRGRFKSVLCHFGSLPEACVGGFCLGFRLELLA
jgi:hypothetical protein